MSSVSTLRSQKKSAQSELTNYKKRKTQLETIKSSLLSTFENYATDINIYNNQVKNYVSSGIKSTSISSTPENLFVREYASSDSNLGSSRSYINLEINRVNQKITELENRIASLDRQIQQALAEERAAAAAALRNALS